MRSHLARHFRAARKASGLSVSQLARLVGYQNVTKGCNRIVRFEQHDQIHTALLRKLAEALGIGGETIEALIERDRCEFLALWNDWASQPIRPYLVIRLVPAVYARRDLPAGIDTIEEAEGFAAQTARHWSKKVCLVWTRRLSLWFDEEGRITNRTDPTPGGVNEPFMRLKASGRTFVLEHAAAGGTVLRLIDWPKPRGRALTSA